MNRIIPLLAMSLTLSLAAAAQDTVTDTLGFRTAVASNPAELLRGSMAGVRVSATDGNPFGEMNISIRGVNTVHGDGQPLWIVDGVMVSANVKDNTDPFWQYGETARISPLNPLSFLSPYEIESIQVLKDASATAMYGTRGANGVIIVTTRLPKEGVRKINWDSNVGMLSGNGTASQAHNHHLSVAGVNGGTSYSLSGTFRSADGVVKGNSFREGSFRASFDSRMNGSIRFGASTILAVGTAATPSAAPYPGQPSLTLALRDKTLSATSVEDWESGYDDDSENYRALTSVFMQLNFTPSLYLRAEGGVDLQYDRRIVFYGAETGFGAVSDDNVNGGMASNMISMTFGYNAGVTLGFNRFFAGKHHVTLALKGETVGEMDKFNTMNGNNFALDIIRGKSLNVGTYTTFLRKFNIDYSHIGASAAMGYDYSGIAGFDLSCRMDFTPKYGTYGQSSYHSASAWLDLQKALFPESRKVSMLKLKGGYGESGYEKYIPTQLFGYFANEELPGIEEGTLSFHDGLLRMHTKEWTAGAEAGLLDGSIRLAATWFDRNTDDSFLIFRTGAPAKGSGNWKPAGCENIFDNCTAIANRGLEISADVSIIKEKDWSWDVTANTTFCENRVSGTDIPTGSFLGFLSGSDGKIIDRTGEGLIGVSDLVNLGSPVPSMYEGFGTALRYRAFTLEAQFDHATGLSVANLNTMFRDGAVTPDGKPALTESFVEKADFLRFSHIGLKWDVPVRFSVFKELSLRLACHNVAVFSEYSGWNPDVSSLGFRYPGADYGSYPLARTAMLGISARF